MGWESDIIRVINRIREVILIQKGRYTPLPAQSASLEFEIPDVVYPCKCSTGFERGTRRSHSR